MHSRSAIGRLIAGAPRVLRFALAVCPLLLAGSASAQSYVGRFEVYEGFMYMNSPKLSLGEPGYHIQAGMRARRWLSLGFDYSRGTGDTALTQKMLISSLQQQFNSAVSSGLLPAGYQLSVPISTVTSTYTAGPQIPIRHFDKVTFFIRPSIGAVKETATIHPADLLTRLIVQSITTNPKLQDWQGFYGVGGGAALNFSKHFSLVMQADYVHDSLFSNVLRSRNSLRLSVGPGFQFGRNISR